MDAFEELVAGLLRREGWWTLQNYKVDLTKQEKQEVGLPTMPRPDIDIVAYRPADNRLAWIECKSYLDSTGVHISAFNGSNPKFAKRFRIFTDVNYRDVVSDTLARQMVDAGLVLPAPSIEYWLVAGKIARGSEQALNEHFAANGWQLRDRSWIRASLETLAADPYQNDVVTMAAKLLVND